MNAIRKALDDIKYRIPKQVLAVTFRDPHSNWRQAPISVDEQILQQVIRPRVMVDMNLVGGQTVVISLDGLAPKYLDQYTVVYEVPMDRVNYRTIVSVLNIGYLPISTVYNSMAAGMGNINPRYMNDVLSAAQRVGDSMSNIPSVSNANVELIGANTIMIRDQQRITSAYQLRCILSNDEELNNISPRSIPTFSRLCELAVKSYIYNTQVVSMDMAFLAGGQELGSIKSYVEGLSDVEEQYQTYLNEVWRPTSVCNDTMQYNRFIKMQISPGL